MTEQKHGVQPREGGPRSLYCYDCGEWVPNTANHEMAREGYFAHSHSCKQGEQKHMSKEAYCSLCEVQCDTNPEIQRLRAEYERLKDDYESVKNWNTCEKEDHEKLLTENASLHEPIGSLDINRLNEIYNAEREGRVVVLPCKVGDTVYWKSHFGTGINQGEIMAIKISIFGFDLEISQSQRNHLVIKREFEKVFLSREEAEAALQKKVPE